MRHSRLFAVGIATAVVLIALARLSAPSSAQTAAKPTAFQSKAPGLKCDTNPKTIATDPFKGSLVGRGVPPGIIPVNDKDSILNSGLPCQESVSTGGQETIALDNLQRGFDFYSWRTFIALNSPADGKSIDQSQRPTLRTIQGAQFVRVDTGQYDKGSKAVNKHEGQGHDDLASQIFDAPDISKCLY